MDKIKRSNNAPVAQTATAQVHAAIKQRILDGDYQPHQYIREASVACELAVSRTPVREALRELVSEGWLEAIPHHGARVAAWTEKDAHEVFEIRLMLEPIAVRLACRHMDNGRLAYLKTLATQMETLTESSIDPEACNELAALNHEFHRELISASGNQRLTALLDGVVRTSVIRRNFANYDATHLRRSMHHHREILQAIEADSPEWAESVMRSHLLAARDLHASFPESMPEASREIPN
ncbi:DNA-binding transcriptional regulator, GntR family [Modicisalibacter muralis]|uniref:DNA-binding transcriptional regulator, GntR family n=1 Tax=Modicisalibacter muralis TaxID=119000 RepID=A0A1G9GGA5_9GAMM|nr:GntR family transcriptional regulator [Halomonas muralis]SDK99671.1 DNA-binding transcriptional regulator, GntR family [Halomonas muralis]